MSVVVSLLEELHRVCACFHFVYSHYTYWITPDYSEKANDPKRGGGRRNEPPAERPQALEPHQLPFEAPPDLPPTQLELLATPK